MNPLQGIVQFNRDRKLKNFDQTAEFKMIEEELMEFFDSDNDADRVDALCDVIVVAVGALHKLGFDPKMALQETVQEITSRKGTFDESTGKWMKDVDQDPDTLYKANYYNAKR